MRLGKRGWLENLVKQEVALHQAPVVTPPEAGHLPLSKVAQARRHIRLLLRNSGLLYGTPVARPAESSAPPPTPPSREEALFLGVLGTLIRLTLDVADLLEAPVAARPQQVLVALATLCSQLPHAHDLHQKLKKAAAFSKRDWTQVEEALEQRAMSLAGDPYYGLVLHNGAVYSDAQLLGRVVLAYFREGAFSLEDMHRRLQFAAAQKQVLTEVLIGLACAERKPSFPTRRAILRQVDDLNLPDEMTAATRRFALKAFEKPPAMRTMLKGVTSRELKRFIVEQTLLASWVDGRRSPREVEYLEQLGGRLGFTAAELKRLEVEMAEFYAKHRELVDVFTVSAGADVMGEELVQGMQTAVERNFQRLLREVKETGELSVLLARAARGQPLSREERKRMREQLIDVAKAVPALAIFAAPGGVLLLIALAKVLPFNILPSAFRDDDEEEAAEGEEAARSAEPRFKH